MWLWGVLRNDVLLTSWSTPMANWSAAFWMCESSVSSRRLVCDASRVLLLLWIGSLNAVTTIMNQNVYFNILDEQVFPFKEHLYDKYAADAPFFQYDNNKVCLHGNILNWFMNTRAAYFILMVSKVTLLESHRKFVGHARTAVKKAEISILAIWLIFVVKSSARGLN